MAFLKAPKKISKILCLFILKLNYLENFHKFFKCGKLYVFDISKYVKIRNIQKVCDTIFNNLLDKGGK